MYQPTPLNRQERIAFYLLVAGLLGLTSFAFAFYVNQAYQAHRNPSTITTLDKASGGIPIPSVYLFWDASFTHEMRIVCNIMLFNEAQPLDCPTATTGNATILIGGQNAQFRWVRYRFNDQHLLRANGVDQIQYSIWVKNGTEPHSYLDPTTQLFQYLIYYAPDIDEPDLTYIIEGAVNIVPSYGGQVQMAYSLAEYTTLSGAVSYNILNYYNGAIPAGVFPNHPYSDITLVPSSPIIQRTKEIISFSPLNVFSSTWAVISFCITFVGLIFSNTMPTIERYFVCRNECLKCCNKTKSINVDEIDFISSPNETN